MRASLLSRSAIAIASLAVGTAVLTAAPATAADPPVITQEMVLQLATSIRAGGPGPDDGAILTPLVLRGCNLASIDNMIGFGLAPVTAGQGDGLLLAIKTRTTDALHVSTDRTCVFTALTPIRLGATLAGNAVITAIPTGQGATPATRASSMSGSVFISAPVILEPNVNITSASLAATGHALVRTAVTTTTTTTTPKTASRLKAAKDKYDKALTTAKKAYKKALKKAGRSSAKKAAAKKKYAAAKASARRTYDKARASSTTVTKATVFATDSRPFTGTATVLAP